MPKPQAFILFFLRIAVLGISVAIAGISGTVLYLNPSLPSVESIREIPLQTPLRIFSKHQQLIAEFGEKKRTPVSINDVPKQLTNAFLAAEDSRFFQHHGVDLKSMSRAVAELVSSGRIHTGGSTITMQLAKNYFLSSERTFLRKGKEVLLALKLERELSKREILELYLNKIYLGNRAYGIAAAAQVYYGKPLNDLTLAECAMLAGLPKAPSSTNPVNNPVRAGERRNWILGRMLELEMITGSEYAEAIKAPPETQTHTVEGQVDAGYVAEMARQFIYAKFGEAAYESGYRVYTTIDESLQAAANDALQRGLITYDQRHGYRGPEGHLSLDGLSGAAVWDKISKALQVYPKRGPLIAAAVLELNDRQATLLDVDGQPLTLHFENARWARRSTSGRGWTPAPTKLPEILKKGDIVRLQALPANKDNADLPNNDRWRLAQIPAAQSALVSLDPNTGAVLALTGGYDFALSKFNRATQGGRQPGSSFKPFIYAAGLAKGLTPATLINDAPFVYEDPWTKQVWRPQNSSADYQGPMRLREALYRSKNTVSVRLLEQIGVDYALNYLKKFSFDPATLPKHLSLALGTAEVTPLQLATGYSVFANGGFQVEPWWVSRIENDKGEVVYSATPAAACLPPCDRLTQMETESDTSTATADNTSNSGDPSASSASQTGVSTPATPDNANHHETIAYHQAMSVEDPRIIWMIDSMMGDVIKRGTGSRALSLKRRDLAGKTGTTNEQKDAWFAGFNPSVVTCVWVGFDTPVSLGRGEFGGTAALPIWIDYMREALKDKPEIIFVPPEGLVSVKIDPATGMLASPSQSNAIFETFPKELVPEYSLPPIILPGSDEEMSIPEQLF
ncbi:Penicillin-binding protein 1A [gamma proteobacterium HdN1]|nr:Penicillin-binding protein 1A [gamma proteobacterium HdN1]